MRTARRGFVLYVIGAIIAVMGSVLLLFGATQRVRDTEVRLTTDEVIARYLARGAVETLSYYAERAVDVPRREPSLALTGGTLPDVLLTDGPSLEEWFRQNGDEKDARETLEQLVGAEPFARIKEMCADFGAPTLSYRVSAKANTPDDSVKDVVPKEVVLAIGVRCKLRHAEQSFNGELGIRVYSALPTAAARFDLVWVDAPVDRLNAMPVDLAGRRTGGPNPVVTFHDPADYDPQDPLFEPLPAPGAAPAPAPVNQTGSLVVGAPEPEKDLASFAKKLAGRGAVYLAGRGGEQPVTLRLAAGSGAAGQEFLSSTDAQGKARPPQARPLEAGKRMEKFRAPVADAKQRAWAQGAAFGYSTGIDADRLLGPPANGEDGGDGTSVLRVSGTAARPSAGMVYGPVHAGLAFVSDLAIDRDDTGADEVAQAAALGRPPPERDAIDPFLRHAAAGEYDADVAHEAAGEPYATLSFFGSPELGPGRVRNLNGAAASEEAHRPIALDLARWRYASLFEDYPAYAKAMSKRLAVPYNALLRAAGNPQAMLARAAAGGEPASADLATEAFWEHTDPLHEKLARKAGHRTYIDSRAGGRPLAQLIAAAFAQPRFAPLRVACKGTDLFRDSFGTAQLDLKEFRVELVPASADAPPPVLELDQVSVVPGGGGVLVAPDVTLGGLVNQGTGAGFSPLVIVTPRLTLKGAGPFEGVFVVGERLTLAGDAEHTAIRGLLITGGGVLNDLARPLAVVRDPRLDPIGPEAHRSYRSAIVWGAGPRISGAGGSLSDFSEYRRPVTRAQESTRRATQGGQEDDDW